MKKTPLLAALLLAAPAASCAQTVAAPRVTTTNLQTSAVAGMSAAGAVLRPAGFGLFSGDLASNTFQSMLQPPLAAVYAATKNFQARVFRGAKIFLASDANVLSYKPPQGVIDIAKGLNMPLAGVRAHENNLIGKRRRRSDFRPGMEEDFFLSNDGMDVPALEKELGSGTGARPDHESVRASLYGVRRRIAPLTAKLDAASQRAALIEASRTFDGGRTSASLAK